MVCEGFVLCSWVNDEPGCCGRGRSATEILPVPSLRYAPSPRTLAHRSGGLAVRSCREVIVLQQVELVISNDRLCLHWRRPPQITSPPHSSSAHLALPHRRPRSGVQSSKSFLSFSPPRCISRLPDRIREMPQTPFLLYPRTSGTIPRPPYVICDRPYRLRLEVKGTVWNWRSFGSVVSSAMSGLVWRAGRGGV